mmetsp:Transcript_24460/g.59335  ORF Transcript_24460/g.59335 Transcript_24460/m.59335 type:complete len:257 (+) Transcript_24460:195-965(+)
MGRRRRWGPPREHVVASPARAQRRRGRRPLPPREAGAQLLRIGLAGNPALWRWWSRPRGAVPPRPDGAVPFGGRGGELECAWGCESPSSEGEAEVDLPRAPAQGHVSLSIIRRAEQRDVVRRRPQGRWAAVAGAGAQAAQGADVCARRGSTLDPRGRRVRLCHDGASGSNGLPLFERAPLFSGVRWSDRGMGWRGRARRAHQGDGGVLDSGLGAGVGQSKRNRSMRERGVPVYMAGSVTRLVMNRGRATEDPLVTV